MSDTVKPGLSVWPAGTNVSAYLASGWAPGKDRTQPQGSAIETVAVAADGSATFATLTAGTKYRIGASVSGTYRFIEFTAGADQNRIDDPDAAEIIGELENVAAGPLAPTYYVDPVAGSDSNDGRSSGAPWKTITKLNATTFKAGDVIALKAGTTLSGALWTFKGSGTVDAPIWITRYGTGADPIMDGQNARTNLKLDATNYVYVERIDFRNANEGGSLNIRNLTAPFLVRDCSFSGNAYIASGGVILVYNCSGGSAPTNLSKLASPRRDRNGIARGAGGRIHNCVFASNSNDCIWFGATPDLEIDHITISAVTGSISDGIQPDGNDAGTANRYSSNYWIHDCSMDFTSSDSPKGGIGTNAPSAPSVAAFLGGMIEGNEITAPASNATVGYGINVGNSGATIQDNRVAGFGNGGNGAISVAGSQATTGVKVIRNKIRDCNQGLFIGGGVRTNITIEDNEIVNSIFRALWWGNDSSTGTCKRNRIWCPQLPTSTSMLRLPPGTGTTGVDSDYNEIGPEQTAFVNWNNTNYATLATYVAAATKDSHTRRLAV